MNAIEIRNLTKKFGDKIAVNELNMTVPIGAIYGFIGENGSGKSTTEKLICGLLVPSDGQIKLFDKDYTDINVRANVGCLIESPGCFSNYSVWNNLMLQAYNLSIPNAKEEVRKVLKMVRMEGAASNKYKNCSLGMKQRIGIAMALLGNPKLLILDEPINGLDADGMRIMREILTNITKNYNCTVVVSSHILGELEKIATHYGIIRNGKMIREMTSEELEKNCPTFVAFKTKDMSKAKALLKNKYIRIEEDEFGYIRVYDAKTPEEIYAKELADAGKTPEEIVTYLYDNHILINEIKTDKIGLEEYYINLMNSKEEK